jgi:hypothetical protein
MVGCRFGKNKTNKTNEEFQIKENSNDIKIIVSFWAPAPEALREL